MLVCPVIRIRLRTTPRAGGRDTGSLRWRPPQVADHSKEGTWC